MSSACIAIVTILYAATACDMLFVRRDPAMALVWIGYAVANVGFLASLCAR